MVVPPSRVASDTTPESALPYCGSMPPLIVDTPETALLDTSIAGPPNRKLLTGMSSMSVIVSPARPPRIWMPVVPTRRAAVNDVRSVDTWGTSVKPACSWSASLMLRTGNVWSSSCEIDCVVPVCLSSTRFVCDSTICTVCSVFAAFESLKLTSRVTSMATVTVVCCVPYPMRRAWMVKLPGGTPRMK